MSEIKPYKEQEPLQQTVGEPMVAYVNSKIDSNIVMRQRDDIKYAISGEELLNRLRPRIKALFK